MKHMLLQLVYGNSFVFMNLRGSACSPSFKCNAASRATLYTRMAVRLAELLLKRLLFLHFALY